MCILLYSFRELEKDNIGYLFYVFIDVYLFFISISMFFIGLCVNWVNLNRNERIGWFGERGGFIRCCVF